MKRIVLLLAISMVASCVQRGKPTTQGFVPKSKVTEYIDANKIIELKDSVLIQKYQDEEMTCRVATSFRTTGVLSISCVPRRLDDNR